MNCLGMIDLVCFILTRVWALDWCYCPRAGRPEVRYINPGPIQRACRPEGICIHQSRARTKGQYKTNHDVIFLLSDKSFKFFSS